MTIHIECPVCGNTNINLVLDKIGVRRCGSCWHIWTILSDKDREWLKSVETSSPYKD